MECSQEYGILYHGVRDPICSLEMEKKMAFSATAAVKKRAAGVFGISCQCGNDALYICVLSIKANS